jgi:DNA-directed RNA polymerase subunit L
MNIAIKEISSIKFNGIISSQLRLKLGGLNAVIANTLRRVVHDDLPIYGFPSELIKIDQNTSTFNNDYMRDHLSQLPILNQDCELSYLDPMYWKDVDYKDLNRTKHQKEKIIEMYINVHNVSPEVMNVQTDNAKFFVDGEIVDMYKGYTEKPLLIQLLPNATFKCHMRSALGTGEQNNLWASGLAFYDEDADGNVTLTVESFGQLSEYTILIKCCQYMDLKLSAFKKNIEQKITEGKISSKRAMILELDDEDHTIGNVINDSLQDHSGIVFAGLSKPDHLVKSIRIAIECTNEHKDPIEPLFQTIEKVKHIFKTILKQLIVLSGSKNDYSDDTETDSVQNKQHNNKIKIKTSK